MGIAHFGLWSVRGDALALVRMYPVIKCHGQQPDIRALTAIRAMELARTLRFRIAHSKVSFGRARTVHPHHASSHEMRRVSSSGERQMPQARDCQGLGHCQSLRTKHILYNAQCNA
jgi:hypothetical protein